MTSAVAVAEKSLLGTAVLLSDKEATTTLFAHSCRPQPTLGRLWRRGRRPPATAATSRRMAVSSSGLIDGKMEDTATSARGRKEEAKEGSEPEIAVAAKIMSIRNTDSESRGLRHCRCKPLRPRRRLYPNCRFRHRRLCRESREEEGEEEEDVESGGGEEGAGRNGEDIILGRRANRPRGLSARGDLQRSEVRWDREKGRDWLGSRLSHAQTQDPDAAWSAGATRDPSDDECSESTYDGRRMHESVPAMPVPLQGGVGLTVARAGATASVRHRKRRKWKISEAGAEGGRSRVPPTTAPAPSVAAAPSPTSVPTLSPLCGNHNLELCRRRRRRSRSRPGGRGRGGPACLGRVLLLMCSWAALAGWSAVWVPRGAEAAKGGEFRCDEKRPSEHAACIPQDYSKYEVPDSVNADNITRIEIALDIQEVLRINDKDYSISFSSYFNVYWHDTRIRLRSDFGREQLELGTKPHDVSVPTNLEFLKDLWVPNILIYNLKSYRVIDVLNQLAGLWISLDKQILYSQATHITFICPMRFDKFPLDKQTCMFTLGSYSYNDAKMVFNTKGAGYTAPKVSNSIALDYAITITKLKPQDTILEYGALGNYSLAGFEMVLDRYVSTYIITYYLPSGLFVIVSWISFLIPMDVIPGRMALLVTLFLVLVNIFNSVTTNTPKAEGLTAIEAWMLACILFVFGALIE